MRLLLKHIDLLFLAFLVGAALVGVVAYEKGLFARTEVESPSLQSTNNPDASLVPADPDLPEDIRIAMQNGVDEKPQRDGLPIPKKLEPGQVHLGWGAALGGKRLFPDDNPWNKDISNAPVDPLSDLIILTIGADKNVHPDFAAEYWNGAPTGIPYIVVEGTQPRVPIVYTAYEDESDPGPYPVPPQAPIEGHPNEDGDRHVIVIDRDNWKLYELFRGFNIGDGRLWRAESGAIFDLKSGELRPEGWTSADAAGLPVFPGLVRYDEVVELGEIRHALRFTVSNSRRAYVPPARHWAARSTDPSLPPMGMRVRLRKDFDISAFPKEAQVILTALKKYGMILADNGSNWFLSGAPDPRWNDEALRTLKKVKGKDFEVVLMEGIVIDR